MIEWFLVQTVEHAVWEFLAWVLAVFVIGLGAGYTYRDDLARIDAEEDGPA